MSIATPPSAPSSTPSGEPEAGHSDVQADAASEQPAGASTAADRLTREEVIDTFGQEPITLKNFDWVVLFWMGFVHVGAVVALFNFSWLGLGLAVLFHWITCSLRHHDDVPSLSVSPVIQAAAAGSFLWRALWRSCGRGDAAPLECDSPSTPRTLRSARRSPLAAGGALVVTPVVDVCRPGNCV